MNIVVHLTMQLALYEADASPNIVKWLKKSY